MTLSQPIEGLWATPASPLPFDKTISVRAFLLEREEGNVIVYSAPRFESSADEIRERGEVTRLLINHGHEGMFGPPRSTRPSSSTSATAPDSERRYRSQGHWADAKGSAPTST